jgi:SAM-dependent methyltransferase
VRWTDDPRLAEIYDIECSGRPDHDFYLSLADDLRVDSVVDIGCGTGVLAVDLARRGYDVIGVDPAEAMLDVARHRSGGDTVTWLHGGATDVPSSAADLVVMTGHVAQYFVDDDDWARALLDIRRILNDGAYVAVETRNPAVDWREGWTRDKTTATYPHPSGGEFTAWVECEEVIGPAASYTSVHVGHTVLPDGTHLACAETLRFRSTKEILSSLEAAGIDIEQTWGDWDGAPATATSSELIVLARRSGPNPSPEDVDGPGHDEDREDE